MTVKHHRIEASATYEFHPARPGIVAARDGILTGCQFALSAVSLTVTALMQPDGSVGVTTYVRPHVDHLHRTNGDHISPSDWGLLTLTVEDLPAEVAPTLAELHSDVDAASPRLLLAS